MILPCFNLHSVAYNGSVTSGNNDGPNMAGQKLSIPSVAGKSAGAKRLMKSGGGGKLGKSSTKSESLSRLRGKGAL